MRSPGPGVKLTEEERHAWHHHLIAERKAAYDKLPARSGLDQYRRREALKRAWWTLTGHLRGGNGEWTAEVAYRQWCETMTELGFADYADDPNDPTPGNFDKPLDNDLHPGIG